MFTILAIDKLELSDSINSFLCKECANEKSPTEVRLCK